MRPSRRRLFAIALAATLTAAGGMFALSGPRQIIRRALRDAFGEDIAADTQTQLFIDAFMTGYRDRASSVSGISRLTNRALTFGLPVGSPDQLANQAVLQFLMSSNVVRSFETGAALSFVALFDPYTSPCTNQLGANWL